MFPQSRFLLVAVALLTGSLCMIHAQEAADTSDAGAQYFKGYLCFTQAERLETSGDFAGALQKLQEGQQLIGGVAKNYPSYQPEVVTYRLKMIEQAQQRIGPKAKSPGVAAPSVMPPPAPPAPLSPPLYPPAGIAAPATGNPMDVANQQYQIMQKENADLQTKVKLYEDGYTRALQERQKAQQDALLLQQELKDIKTRMEKLANDAAATGAATTAELQKLKNEARMINEMIASRDAQLQEKDKTIAALQGEKTNWETRQKELEEKQKKLEGEVAMLKSDGTKPDELKKLVAENSRLKDELDGARKQIETLKVSGEKKDEQIASLRTQITTIQGDLTKLRQENTTYQTQVADLTVKLKEMNSQLTGGRPDAKPDARLVEENTLLRTIIMRELRHQERQRQAKELVIAEMKKMENSSRQLMDHLEEMTSVRIHISAAEELLFTEPEVKEIQASSGVRATLTAEGATGDGDGKKPDMPETKAEVVARKEDPKAAEKAFQDTLRKQPKNVPALVGLAALKLQQKKYDDARVLLQKSLVAEPDNDVANYRLGVCYFQQKKMNEALTSFEKSVKKNTDNARAHHYLGIITSSLGNRHRAESEFKQALAVDPNYADAHFNLAVLYATNSPPDWDQARKHYQDALDRGVKPDDSMEKLLKKAALPTPGEDPKTEAAATAALR